MLFRSDYVTLGPRRSHLFPHAHETLSYLQKRYTLHIITNGFGTAMPGQYSDAQEVADVIGYLRLTFP